MSAAPYRFENLADDVVVVLDALSRAQTHHRSSRTRPRATTL
ncbi:hypothetical protein [Pseudonocardia sp. HH130630-07]|nr:hypothetical protein [Pseudonocardia sp. HH130630-07]